MIDDLEHRLDFVVAERERHSGIAKRNLEDEAIRNGSFGGSRMMLGNEVLAREQLDAAILELATDVEKAKHAGVPEDQLRPALDRAVSKLLEMLRNRFTDKPNPAFGETTSSGARSEALRELEARALSLVRMYWGGYLSHSTPHGTVISLTVTGSPGAAVQVGGVGNAQTVTNTTLNISAAQAAAAGLEAALAELPASDARADAEADLASLQRHLAKSEPPPGLLKELGKTLRTGVGKAFAGFSDKSGEAAAEALWDALDL